MAALTPPQRQAIKAIVTPPRARFDKRERRVYSHDVATLPKAFRMLDRATLADGVVQPETEEQLIQLVEYASAERIALVPRGKGTSGYGGAVPARGGLVIDLTRMRGITHLAPDRATVTVLAGTIWKDLQAALAEHGLAPRLYPTSAPSSTVGGWLAQGGAGLGSHAYGWFAENVRSARIVTGTGDVRDLAADELAAIASAEGTTGIITEVTLAIRPLVALTQTAIHLADGGGLSSFVQLVRARRLPVWSLMFWNDTSTRLHEQPGAGRPTLPAEGYAVLCVCDADACEVVQTGLRAAAHLSGGELLPEEVAQHLWAERFKPMRLKRHGPSLIPVEMVVPTSSLSETLEDLDGTLDVRLALEGLSVRGEEIVLLGFIPHDERTLAFTVGYGFALSAIRVAERHGGRAYSTGRYFGNRAERVLGADKVATLRAAKAAHDPTGILNPGKVVFGNGAIGAAIRLASSAEPVVRRVARSAGRPPTVQPTPPADDFRAQAAELAYTCAQCGYCVDVCPQYLDSGWETHGPRGKWDFLKSVFEGRDRFDNEMMDIFAMCVGCAKCDEVCQVELPIVSTWNQLRQTMMRGVLTRSS